MKTSISILAITMLIAISAFTQTPQAFRYQTVVRDAAGDLIQDQNVNFRMSVWDMDEFGVADLEYQETHSVTTNQLGLVNFNIGGGNVVSGAFTGIEWGTNSKVLEVELDPSGGTSYISMGYTQLLSVPFSLYAESTGDINEIVNFAGDTKINMPFNDKSIRFISQNSEFMRMTSSGYLGIGTTTPNEMLEVNGNIRMQDGNQGTGKIMVSDGMGTASWTDPSILGDGGWTVSGNSMYSSVSGNVGIGTTSPGAKLDVAGRIWQTGLGNSIFIGENAGENDDLSDNANVFIGKNAGQATNTGTYNVAIGYESLYSNTNGHGNISLGLSTLHQNTTGGYNMASGWLALNSNTTGSNNIALGKRALQQNIEGNHNIAQGYFALHSNTFGNDNIAFGNNTLLENTTAYSNIAIGASALYKNTTQSNTVAIGDSALFHNGEGATTNNEGINNTAIGSKALYSNTTGYGNTANGFEALHDNTSGNNNTALGFASLYSTTSGYFNTALGSESLALNETGDANTAIGFDAMLHNSTGSSNVGIGIAALVNNESGNYNVAVGVASLFNNEGHSNVAIGVSALYNNTTQSNNVAIGDSALYHNGEGATANQASKNTAIGSKALYSNTTGYANTAVGFESMKNNTTGYGNNAFAQFSLHTNTTGSGNSAFGSSALYDNTSGSYNTALGIESLRNNITGGFNTALGLQALVSNSSGYNNTAGGYRALAANDTGGNNTAFGIMAGNNNASGDGNVFIGNKAGYYETGSDKLYIENDYLTPDNALIYGEFDNDILKFHADVQLTKSSGDEMIIKNDDQWQHYIGVQDFGDGGDYFIMASKEGSAESAGIFGDGNHTTIWSPGDAAPGQNAAYLYILDEDGFDSDGDPYNDGALKAYLSTSGSWVSVSDKNKKENIKPLSSSLDKLMNINGYSYSLKQSDEEKTKGTKQETTYGVLAQEVEQVLPEVIEKNDNGDYFVSYSEFIPVLIEAVKEQQQTIEELRQNIEDLQGEVNQLKKK